MKTPSKTDVLTAIEEADVKCLASSSISSKAFRWLLGSAALNRFQLWNSATCAILNEGTVLPISWYLPVTRQPEDFLTREADRRAPSRRML